MRIASDHILAVTHALLCHETALQAIATIRPPLGRAELDGLVELIYDPPSCRAAVAAIGALRSSDERIVVDALTAALDSPWASLRIAAAQGLRQRRAAAEAAPRLAQRLDSDTAWMVRQNALRALAELGDTCRWLILNACDDPHWRVRYALIQQLLQWGEEDADERQRILDRLDALATNPRAAGVKDYLQYRWLGGPTACLAETDDPTEWCPFWDWDSAVLARTLERMDAAARREFTALMPRLLAHDDERVRRWARDSLLADGGPSEIADTLQILAEPRRAAVESLHDLLERLDLDRTEAAARLVLSFSEPLPAQLAWAIDQVDAAFPLDDAVWPALRALMVARPPEHAEVRIALARLAGRSKRSGSDSWQIDWLAHLLDDPVASVRVAALHGMMRQKQPCPRSQMHSFLVSDNAAIRCEALAISLAQECEIGSIEDLAADRSPLIRARLAQGQVDRAADSAILAQLQKDPHPHVRAAALTPARAAELIARPQSETSWFVLKRAARLTKTPFWELEPDPIWQAPRRSEPLTPAISPRRSTAHLTCKLGPERLSVSPVGVSGHYLLPESGLLRAVEAGINLLFWEPNYATMTRFARRLSKRDRAAIHFIAGTFQADDRGIERDVQRAQRLLGIERISIFLLLWVRSWNRVSDDVRGSLERFRETGRIGAFGLSTHSRQLAVQAVHAGWDPVMVRHSAAHRGAEELVLPAAARQGTSVITFNSTCYGRLLRGMKDCSDQVRAADCYRYSLSQPGVSVCLSAPSTTEQLEENLAAVHDPRIAQDAQARLLSCGDRVYREDRVFHALIRAR